MYIGLVHATGSVSRTFKLIVCSFAHRCSTEIHGLFAWPRVHDCRFPIPLLPANNANASRRKQSVVGILPSSQPHHSTNAFKTPRRREAFACPCLPGRHAILPSPYPACRMNAPLARALALTVRLLSIATPPLSCVACRWAIHRAPPTLHAQLQLQLTASSI